MRVPWPHYSSKYCSPESKSLGLLDRAPLKGTKNGIKEKIYHWECSLKWRFSQLTMRVFIPSEEAICCHSILYLKQLENCHSSSWVIHPEALIWFCKNLFNHSLTVECLHISAALFCALLADLTSPDTHFTDFVRPLLDKHGCKSKLG